MPYKAYLNSVKVMRSRLMADWIRSKSALAKTGDENALRITTYLYAQLSHLKDLQAEPEEDTATLKKVVQSGKYPIWRLSHPYDDLVALRTIVWFDEKLGDVVLVVLSHDKKKIGDIFYNSVGSRADQVIQQYIRERDSHNETE